VGGHIAISITPLQGRIRKNEAILTGRKFTDFLTPFALFNDGMAGAAIKLAATLTHEKTLTPFFYSCTNHFNHTLSLIDLNRKTLRLPDSI
jgi:hypothetical protein